MALSTYLVLKLVHILAGVFLLGNWTTLVLWKAWADRTGDPKLVAAVADRVFHFDRKVTAPAAAIAFVAGYVIIRPLGEFGGRIGGVGWAVWGLILFFVAMTAWYFGMRPLEHRMAELAEGAAERGEELSQPYRRASVYWLLFAIIAIAAGAVAASLMVFKPVLWPS